MNAKSTVRKLLDELPESSTLEDIQYMLYVRGKIDRGLADLKQGRIVSHEDAKQRLSKWLVE